MIRREDGLIRKVLFQGFIIIISGILIGYLLHRIGIKNVVEHLQSVNVFWLCGACVLFVVSLFIGSCQWWILLRSEGIILKLLQEIESRLAALENKQDS